MMLAGAHAAPIAQGPVIPHYERASNCIRENGQFCFSWFVDNFDRVFVPRLVEHIWLTLLAVGIGFVIAFTAALLAYTLDWFETPFVIFAAFLYTIPSLAFFQLLVPITGLTVTSAEIALVSYTLLILFRNTLTGLREVPEDARLAARAMGLTKGQILRRVELPLALPAIMAGIRIATVTTISLATVAAFIGVGGPRPADLQRDPERLQDAVRRRRPPGRRAGAGGRRPARAAPAPARPMAESAEGVT